MRGKRIEFAPKADGDLNQLFRYIAEQSGLTRATTVADRLDRGMVLLASRPRIGRPTRHAEPGSRAFTVRPWVIYYDLLPKGDGIQVLRVIDSRRDLDRMFRRKP